MILYHFYLCQADEVNKKNFDFSFVIVFRKLGTPQIIHPTHETFQVRNYERQIYDSFDEFGYIYFTLPLVTSEQ